MTRSVTRYWLGRALAAGHGYGDSGGGDPSTGEVDTLIALRRSTFDPLPLIADPCSNLLHRSQLADFAPHLSTPQM
jgi:hypothetical protein